MSVLRLPAEWEIIDDIAIIDPDGWDRRNYDESWGTPISYAEWKVRMWKSTVASGLRQWKRVDEDLAARLLAEEALCTCTNMCPEDPEANDCPPCRSMDPYEPCPVIGFGCGSDCGDDEHCTPEQQRAADS